MLEILPAVRIFVNPKRAESITVPQGERHFGILRMPWAMAQTKNKPFPN
jgi:hypothetical protein